MDKISIFVALWATLMCRTLIKCNLQFLRSVQFVKTSVNFDHPVVVKPSIFQFPIKTVLQCSVRCVDNYDCRKFMITADKDTGEALCAGYSDGTDCVVPLGEEITQERTCYRKLKQSDGTQCYSPIGYYGPNCEHIITDCLDGKNQNFTGKSLSFVKPSQKRFEVQCDFDVGSTVIQTRRSDTVAVNFTRPWVDYLKGFGNTYSEYWVGLKNIYDLTNQDGVDFILSIRIQRIGFEECVNTYEQFKLRNDYGVTYSSFTFGCPPPPNDKYFSQTTFSTFDAHRNAYTNPVCDLPDGGGWWFRDTSSTSYCTFSNLNDPIGSLRWYTDEIKGTVLQLDPYA